MTRGPLRALQEGDRVSVRTGFSTSVEGTVDRSWRPGHDGKVVVVLDGKTKPREFDAGRVRLVERPASSLGEVRPRKVRAGTTQRPELRAQPKPPGPYRSRAYLAFVREHPCCSCRSTKAIEAHHWAEERGVAQKVDDTRTVPLCTVCHDHVHAHGCLPNRDVLATRLWFLDKQVRLLTAWVRRRDAERTLDRAHEGGAP